MTLSDYESNDDFLTKKALSFISKLKELMESEDEDYKALGGYHTVIMICFLELNAISFYGVNKYSKLKAQESYRLQNMIEEDAKQYLQNVFSNTEMYR